MILGFVWWLRHHTNPKSLPSGVECHITWDAPKWPLIACVVGAVAVYWYGPMLIVFSMLSVGTISVFLQTWLLLNRERYEE
jgi:hypothetical protein